VLRYWETEFRSIRPQKSRKGQRIYSRKDVDRLLKVRELLYTHGFTIAGARKRMREGGVEPSAANNQARSGVLRLRQTLTDIRQDVVGLLAEFGAPLPSGRSEL
jgi:DNA-binding transcriptional MerR regulator